jgi:mono/diheme cytochrome c family protein
MLLGLSLGNASAQDTVQIARGRYLVEGPASCGDCHTPGGLSGKPDLTRYLGGSDVGLAVPGLSVFVPPNLTPDNQTGLGNWTTEQIVTASVGWKADMRLWCKNQDFCTANQPPLPRLVGKLSSAIVTAGFSRSDFVCDLVCRRHTPRQSGRRAQ